MTYFLELISMLNGKKNPVPIGDFIRDSYFVWKNEREKFDMELTEMEIFAAGFQTGTNVTVKDKIKNKLKINKEVKKDGYIR